MGVAEADLVAFGQLLGAKVAINEFVAFVELGRGNPVDPRSTIIATYALCGFANFSSIGIQIGGISGIASDARIRYHRPEGHGRWSHGPLDHHV